MIKDQYIGNLFKTNLFKTAGDSRNKGLFLLLSARSKNHCFFFYSFAENKVFESNYSYQTFLTDISSKLFVQLSFNDDE